MKKRDVFLLALTFLLLYTTLTNTIFGRPGNGDQEYHLIKSLHPLSCCNNEYYAPLFHIIVWSIALFTGTFNAINLFVALLLFYLLPAAFSWAYNSFWGEDKDATTYYFLVPFFAVLMLIINTWPQALNMFFMLILLATIFSRGITPLIFCISILGFFSHTAGGFWIIAVALLYFLLSKNKFSWLLIGLVLLMILFYPHIYFRPESIVKSFTERIDLNIERMIEVILLWINPLNLYLIYCGLKDRRYYSTDDLVLWFAVFVAFASAILDSELRPILNGMLLLGLYGFRGFEMHPKISRFLVVYGILWWITLIYGVIIM